MEWFFIISFFMLWLAGFTASILFLTDVVRTYRRNKASWVIPFMFCAIFLVVAFGSVLIGMVYIGLTNLI